MGINRRILHYRRYRQIAEALMRHGFGYLIDQVDLRHLIPFRWRWFRPKEPPKSASLGERIRRVFEELGPTFVKLGQMLSSRTDVVPQAIAAELSRLQDDVPSFPAEEVRRIVEQELGRPIEDVLRTFDEAPLAAASIAQVHRGTLHSGEDVVLKVRRPDIEKVIETDVGILLRLSRQVKERLAPELFDPVSLVEEFARTIRREIDFRIEGKHLQRFYDNFVDVPGVHIPRVYWQYTTSALLVMEYVDGVKVTDLAGLAELGVDRHTIARRGAEAFFKQVMIDGYFHGDPHPGNLLVEADGTLALIDFGLVGRLERDEKEALADMFLGVVGQDVGKVVQALRRMGAIGVDTNLATLRVDLADLIDRHYGKRLGEIEMGSVLSSLLEVTQRHRLRLPTDFLLLGKAFVTMEGVARVLDPAFNVIEVAEPFARELMEERYSPSRLAEKGAEATRRYMEVAARLPLALDQAMGKLAGGELEVVLRHKEMDRMIQRLDVVSNRISFSLIIGALIVGSSIVIQAQVGPMFLGMPLIGVIGYVAAGFFGVGLVVSMWRSGRL